MKKVSVIILLALSLLLSSCANAGIKNLENVDKPSIGDVEHVEEEKDIDSNETDEESNKIDYEKIKPNENGKVMILMYHGIGEEESEWVRTVENFKKDLQTLYDKGYRLLSLRDYINNNINIEAGYTPVVITFDDGLLNQFNLIEEGGETRIDPNCAVGVLEDFYKDHPDFGRAASFFVYYPVPFRQKELIKDKFDFLIENGYEIGNHGYNHENLGKVSIEEVQESLSKNARQTKEILGDYIVESLALPYGAAPKGDGYKYVISGSFEGFNYFHKAVLKVGSNPAPSPNSIDFDPQRLPRVRASEMKVQGTGIYDYLKYFENNPDKKYVSDGDPNTVTIPESEISNIDIERLEMSNKKLITYNLESNKKADEN
ncbi:polysaccharide deacetylase family protein [Lutispora sp.]|jgi:peptidoglycan/xylan/chitin deacetylase (PgdA/CDA1 family)|uniref:polysaccharide deacetylase family protein n=1 Tax=Lutispora sp. TaxID=2828727 RepID=UPI0035678392